MINQISLRLLYLNFGHFIDHMLILIFAKAAFSAGIDFGFGKDGAYAEMLFYGIPSLVLFGACAPIAAHMADHWNRNGMLTVFLLESDWLLFLQGSPKVFYRLVLDWLSLAFLHPFTIL